MGQKTKIEWSDSTWNPVTGCKHECPYCYARDIAHRFEGGGYGKQNGMFYAKYKDDAFSPPYVLDDPQYTMTKDGWYREAPYPFDFAPTFHRYRLKELSRKTPRTVFVGSMCDLFGKWVPTKWIVEVLDACFAAPQHRYLFLTKNPGRYLELDQLALLPRLGNFWFGSTVTKAGDRSMWCDGEDERSHWFISVEPLHGQISVIGEHPPEWVVVGAETGNRKDRIVPERAWVEKLVLDCQTLGVPLFMKDSLKPIWGEQLITEFPWEVG